MILRTSVYLLCCAVLSECYNIINIKNETRCFPEGFLFGAATSAYQVEGGWNEDGKSESIWDHLTHSMPCFTGDCSNGDIAADSYHQYKRDVEMIRELGLDYYRFSLSWTRILPNSFPNQINEAGVSYYNNLINEMLKYNIQPVVTLYHWDLPQKLQKMGGWANPCIVDWYADYCRISFELFGDRVKYWITINEPHEISHFAYGSVIAAPRLNISDVGEYLCAKNLLMGHAKAYHIYDEEYRPTQNGSIFIVLNTEWYEPETENDVEAANEAFQFGMGLFAHPIFSETGDFPPVMKKRIAAKSSAQGYFRSRLPDLIPEEVEYVKGTSDYYGLNHYTTVQVSRNASVVNYYPSPSYRDDLEVYTSQSSEWCESSLAWLKVVPWGFYKLLMKIKCEYNNPPVFVAENGFPSRGGLADNDRIAYHRQYVSAMLDAVDDGADVRAYTVWSLMDNFEWIQGYTPRFGLYEVDYASPLRTRTARKSAFVFKEMVRTRTLDLSYEPVDTAMTIDPGH